MTAKQCLCRTVQQHVQTHTHTDILRPLHRSTAVSKHPKLRTGRFCWSKFYYPMPLWWQLAHSDSGKNARWLVGWLAGV